MTEMIPRGCRPNFDAGTWPDILLQLSAGLMRINANALTQINARSPHPDEGKNKALAPVVFWV
ncbi:hypothetical protein [Mesorhizobium sp.]|uniref:hypothetical protein n=1 Tax=Mesorhizobium sp. TaxID=1871066 RepID=UPI000FEA6893|nr:hypothetical protein [Mesorhizobium sp.]RWM33730.1 MAG: hypothetical protein EOR75_27100 [Mesorhizobium sp.]TIO74263.1 MAG: hypothetical protein E5X75_24385 [Mesorhizobium sp.]TIO82197.1 MAG: hypothetical protein E5X74_25995 [Mesorhizobium sp.]TJV49155.1 MAG: hypothetical protein E5Y01_24700 [Mesorhizobium sp.]